MSSLPIAEVAVPSPLHKSFDYRTDGLAVQVGMRVLVPFGRQKLVGIVLALKLESEWPVNKLRPIEHLLDHQPFLPTLSLRLAHWIASYYHAPIGEVMPLLLPPIARKDQEVEPDTQLAWYLTDIGKAIRPEQIKGAAKQQRLMEFLQTAAFARRDDLKALSVSRSTCLALESKGWLKQQSLQPRSPLWPTPSKAVDLNHDQQQIVDSIKLDSGFNCHLLEGVTGSGKTHVYAELARRAVAEGKQVLILVPEISLTPQTIARVQRLIGLAVSTYHSGLSDRQRLNIWLSLRDGNIPVLIGTRSAALMSFNRLGLIIVDEEHDRSFKQQDGVRLHARDLLVKRAADLSIPIVLGSATPSLESLANVRKHRYISHYLGRRASAHQAAVMQVIDQRLYQSHGALTAPALQAIRSHLGRGRQVLVFLNRRGWAPSVICDQCGEAVQCPHCSASMTYHRQPNEHLRCHHCGYRDSMVTGCPHCDHDTLQILGQGTAQLEHELNAHFGQYPVIRIDRDNTKTTDQLMDALEPVHEGEACILVGTQMLAKGHDFPNLTLTVMVNADVGLFSSDFRAAEQTLQQIIQVAGRAGRAEAAGEVLIQSRIPDHPLVKQLPFLDYRVLSEELLRQRRELELPPYSHVALIRADHKDEQRAYQWLCDLRTTLGERVHLYGPIPAYLHKRANRFRFYLWCQGARADLHQVLFHATHWVDQQGLPSGMSWGVDVDPLDLS